MKVEGYTIIHFNGNDWDFSCYNSKGVPTTYYSKGTAEKALEELYEELEEELGELYNLEGMLGHSYVKDMRSTATTLTGSFVVDSVITDSLIIARIHNEIVVFKKR